MQDIKNKVEAILFAAGRTVKLEEVSALLELKETGLIKEAIKDLKEEYVNRDSPTLLIEEGEGWKLTVQEKYLSTVRKINPHTELSRAVMETLAVIAWKAPILQSDVIRIRTNKAYEHIAELANLGFLTKERQGRSFILRHTQKFMDYFDLPDNQSVKGLFAEFKDLELIPQKQVEDFNKNQEEGVNVSDKLGSLDIIEEPETFDSEDKLKVKESLGNLSVYNETEEEQNNSQEVNVETKELIEETSSDSESEEIVEDESTKAKRLAAELLATENAESKKEELDEVEERQLHPELENFLSENSVDIDKSSQTKNETETQEESQDQKNQDQENLKDAENKDLQESNNGEK